MTEIKPVPLDAKYAAAIAEGLRTAYKGADEEAFDPARDRLVVFSDHHKGIGDPADDFRRCEHAYTSALGYYLEAGYRLLVLGDAEELWEEHAEKVIERYRAVLDLEAQFIARGNGLDRFFGNHDDQWESKEQVDKHFKNIFGDITVRQALRLRLDRPGKPAATLFFVHGHQGTADSDRWGWASRAFVRHVWRPLQRKTGYSATTPARSYELRAKHDRAMYEWAAAQPAGLIMIAGHTHRPVFSRSVPDPPPTRPTEELEQALAQASGDRAQAARIRAELEYARTSKRRPEEARTVPKPCYFNSGCCSFPDGDVTGLEIADDEIRLVRWPGNIRELCAPAEGVDPGRRVLARESLDAILTKLHEPVPAGQTVEEHRIAPE